MQRRLTTHCGKTVLLVQKVHFGEKQHCFNFTVSADYWHLKWKVKLFIYILSCLFTFSDICLHYSAISNVSSLFNYFTNEMSAICLQFSNVRCLLNLFTNDSCLFTICKKVFHNFWTNFWVLPQCVQIECIIVDYGKKEND